MTWAFVDGLELVEVVEADLRTEKTLASADATPAAGDTVTFSITVTNDGPDDATNVTLTDSIPSGLSVTGNNGNVTAGTYVPGTGIWTIPSLINGASATLTIEGTVNADQGGATITNTTTAATSDVDDPSTTGDDLTESVVVDNVLVPDDDSGTAVSGTVSTPVANVTATDTVNGAAADLTVGGNATISEDGTWPTGFSLNTTTGAVEYDGTSVLPGAYTMDYELCDLGTPANCETATVTVTVGADIVPDDDSGTAVSGTVSTPVANVTATDTVNGAAVDLTVGGNATISEDGTWPTGFSLNTTTGAVEYDGTSVLPGAYTMDYELCDLGTPANCETATVTVTVGADIVPDDDSGTAVSGTVSTPVANVTATDTVNGAAADLTVGGNATISEDGTWPTGFSLNTTTGAVEYDGTSVLPGAYTMDYELCDLGTPANCETATVTVTVGADIVPDDDSGTAVSGTVSTPVANVTATDTVNGAAADLTVGGNATISEDGTWPTGFSLNTTTGAVEYDGTSVLPGAYTMDYELCDLGTPANCETATVTVTVGADIVPDDDSGTAVSGTVSTPVANVTATDTVNGAAVDLTVGGNATISEDGTWPTGFSLNTTTGAVEYDGTSVLPGAYTMDYELCDLGTPANCETATVTVTVGADIVPDDDSGTAVSGTVSTPVANVTATDTVNGAAADLTVGGNATISEDGTWPTGFSLNTTTGAVEYDGTSVLPGAYTMDYELCDLGTPANCETATVTVTVGADIVPDDDSGTAVSGTVSTPVANVTATDTVNGAAADLTVGGNATISEDGTWPTGFSLNTTTGAVEYDGTSVLPGAYTMDYELCDLGTPANCETATVTVTVGADIVPDDDSGTAVSGTVSTPVANVTATDTVNGAAVDLTVGGNATISEDGTWPTGFSLNTTTGAVEYDGTSVLPGAYTMDYELCDLGTPANCETATVTVTVGADIVPDDDSGTAVSGTVSTPVANVTATDTVNGAAVDLTVGGNATISEDGTWPTGFSLNTTTGAVEYDGTSVLPGAYTMDYELCDLGTPANCETATVTVTVGADIVPDDDSGTAVSGTVSTPVANVTATDTVNGAAVDLTVGGNATISEDGTWPTGFSLNTTTGAVEYDGTSVLPGAYTMDYELCDLGTPANCETATVTVTVGADIVPDDDSGTAVSGTVSTPVANVTATDTVNGAAADLTVGGNATISEDGTWPTGFSLNTTTGAVEYDGTSVLPGAYTMDYELCDLGTPANCETATVTVTVGADIVPDDDSGTAVSGTVSTPVANVTATDTVNGAAADLTVGGNATISEDGTWPTGFSLNTTTGAVEYDGTSVLPGAYTMDYELCDLGTPANCETATVTVTVGADIVPDDDSGTAVSGTVSTPVANVTATDTVNGAAVDLTVGGNATISEDGTWPTGFSLNTTTGAVEYDGTSVLPGAYTMDYELCDLGTPANCETATVTVTVGADIVPDDDSGTAVSGTVSTPVANVTATDTVNGAAVDLTVGGNATISEDGTWPTGFSLNTTTGAVEYDGTSVLPGAYTMDYELCDLGTPANCETATVTVTVGADIVPDDDSGTAVSGTVSTPVANVTATDTVNGAAVDLTVGGNATISEDGTWPTGFSLNTTTGAVEYDGTSVLPGAYTMDYELCDLGTPANCETATVTVTVGADIVPDDDSGTAVSGTVSTPVANVTATDTVNGAAVDLTVGGNATISEDGTWPTGFSLNTTTGAVEYDGTSVLPGAYTMDYELCDLGTPANCETATVTVTVGADIVPDDDSGTAVSGTVSTPVANVTATDTVNGAAADLTVGGNATISEDGTWPTGFSLNTTTGAVEYDGTSVLPGAYTMDYELCDLGTPANCETATVTVTVGADIVPDDDSGTAVSGTVSTPVANVTATDTVNGAAADLTVGGNATISEDGTWPTGFSLNTTTGAVEYDGTSVLPGAYTMDYELCDLGTPANCETATVTVTVGADIVPDDDSGTAVSGTVSTPVANVTATDTVNGAAVDLTVGGNATISEDGTWPTGFSLNTTTGAVEYDGTSVLPGAYTMDYELCDLGTPANCETATVTVTVGADIVPDDDSGTAVSGTVSTPVANVTATDTVNGAAADLTVGGNATISEDGTWPTGFSLNTTTGAVEYDGTSVLPGAYTMDYELCDLGTPANCETATVTVTVGADIVPDDDSGTAVSGTVSTPVANVTATDTVNGAAVDLTVGGNATISEDGTWPTGFSLNTTTGAVEYDGTSVLPGAYTMDYELCDLGTPANCETATVTVTVGADIVPDDDSGTAVSGTVSTPVANVTATDTVNGAAVDLTVGGNATISEDGTWPTGFSLNTTTGAVEYDGTSVLPGAYTMDYELCDLGTPANCETATVTVTVGADIVPDDDSGTAVSGTVSTPVANVTATDTVNGAAVDLTVGGNATISEDGTWPTGFSLNTTTGAVEYDGTSVLPGAYTMDYELCDLGTPANCETATVTVTVGADIVPDDDSGTAVSGTVSTPVANVTATDTVNGAAVDLTVGGNATISEDGTWPTGFSLNTTTGAVEYDGTSVLPGAYTMDYELCDLGTPANCETATVTVTVGADIVPDDDSGTAVSGTVSTPVANVTATDTVNGAAVDLTVGGNATISEDGTWPTGFSLNTTTGAVEYDGTSVLPGAYTMDYELCDLGTPANCETATVTVTVGADIVPDDDSGTAVSGTVSTPVANVTATDTVNGAAADLTVGGNATISEDGTWPTGFSLNTTTGAVEYDGTSVLPGAYTMDYELCDLGTPANCETATVTVTVGADIVPDDDSGTAVSGTVSTPVANVTATDTVNGAAVDLTVGGNATISEDGTWPTGFSLNTTTGAVEYDGTSVLPGAYTMDYELCDLGTPANCETATVTVTVGADIVPDDDSGTAVSGTVSTPVANVTATDTVNGVAVDLTVGGNATISEDGTWPTGFSLNTTTGAVEYDGTSVLPGAYTMDYELCDLGTPANCETATVTVTVGADIVPDDDSGTAVSGTVSTPVANVTATDTVNGAAADLTVGGNATISEDGTWPTGFSLNTTTGAVEYDGTSVLPGAYTMDYELCDLGTPANCETATVTVTVGADIVPDDDSGTAVSGTVSTPVANMTATDTVNGAAVDLTVGGNATISEDGTWPTGFSLNTTTGAVEYDGTSVLPGAYTMDYELCDLGTPANCETATVTVTVGADIVPDDDSGTAVSGTVSTPVANVTATDTVNGAAADLTVGGNATISEDGTWPTGFSLNTTTGAVEYDGTSVLPGAYTMDYELCDLGTPANCETATVTVTVGADIVPDDDSGTAVSGTVSTPVANVTATDTVNGAAVDLTVGGNATISEDGTWPTGFSLNTTTGAVEYDGTSVLPGAYTMDYELCDLGTPANCETATVTVTVGADIVPDDDSGTAVSGTVSTPVANVTATDTVNGAAVDLTVGGNATISEDGTWPTGFSLNTTTGAVEYDGTSVLPGAYTMDYELCDLGTPANCETATVTVTVGADIVPDDDSGTAVSGTVSTPVANVTATDTVNGAAVDLTVGGNATISEDGTWPTGFSLNTTTGAVEYDGTSVLPGAYTMDYELCDLGTPANCETATVTVTVGADIVPDDDSGTAVSGTVSTPVANVTATDTVNGAAADLTVGGNATISEDGTWPTGFSLNTTTGAVEYDGTSVLPGAYTMDYELCDLGTPANCETATVTVTVGADIVPDDDSGTAVSGTVSTPVANVTATDTVNGAAVDLTVGGNATISEDGTWPTGFSLNTTTGAVEYDGTSVLPGAYTMDYELCDLGTPANCETATVTVTVGADIVPDDDSGTAVSGTVSTPVANVTATDTVNGAAADLTVGGNATISEDGTWPTGFSLNTTTGAVEYDGTSVLPGAYTMDYELCDLGTPANCETATVTVTVGATPIEAVDDTPALVDGATGGTIPNVVTNDRLNGAANPTIGVDVIVNGSGIANSGTVLGIDVTPALGGITMDTSTGVVAVSAGTTAGTYIYTYEICEMLNPINCDTARVTIVVDPLNLILRIEDELETILEEDLANTLTMQSNQISGYSADALDRLRMRSHDECRADANARLAVENILFDTDKAIIKPESDRTLDDIAAILMSCPSSAFEIAGHTDSDASDEYNVDLSQRRVVAVRQALAQRGVDTTGYIARGYGESLPIASNATEEGKAQNRRVEFQTLDDADSYQGPCDNSFSLERSLNANANDDGMIADGQFVRDQHDCLTDRREVFEGSLSYSDTGQGQTQSAINLSYRREQYRGSDSVFGYFVGLYGSQSDVTRLANGEIRGFGLNAGVYGANRLDNELYLDYYLGAAAGRHEFDLAFARDIGTIDASGNYQYIAGFAGAAISGEVEVGGTTLTPRIGFDYVYTPGADVDVVAEFGSLSEVGGLELDAISGGRVFAEVRMDHLVDQGRANLWFNPRLACYQSLGSLDGVCGIGGSIGIENTDEDSNLTYSFEIDGEWGQDYTLGSFTASVGRQIGLGTFSGDATMSTKGSVTLGGTYEIGF
ncbi:OmpA family protein [Yoonia sp. MH D7]